MNNTTFFSDYSLFKTFNTNGESITICRAIIEQPCGAGTVAVFGTKQMHFLYFVTPKSQSDINFMICVRSEQCRLDNGGFWGPPSPLLNGTRGSSPGREWQGHAIDHNPLPTRLRISTAISPLPHTPSW